MKKKEGLVTFSAWKKYILTLPEEDAVAILGDKLASKLRADPASLSARDIAMAPLSLEELSKW